MRYQNSDRKILLQNENGPCPLLAAANALLLKGVISLPSESIRSGVASTDDVVNILAERALLMCANQDTDNHHLHELLTLFPNLQYGMDVNPKFTAGPTGVEYTSNLTAFDMLNVDLVHGWLLDPQDEQTFELVGSKTYNELIEIVVQGNEASAELEMMSKQIVEKEEQLEEVLSKRIVEKEEQLEEVGKEEEGWVNVASDSVDVDGSSLDETCRAVDDGSDGLVLVKDATKTGDVEEVEAEETTDSVQDKAVEGPKAEELNAEESKEETKTEESKISETIAKATKSAEQPKAEETIDTTNEKENKATTTETEASKAGETEHLSVSKLEQELVQLKEKRNELATLATNGSLINSFLASTGHQLTHYGLHELYNHVGEESLCVFFRNNHFGTLTKHKGVLFLLVTDLGYANVPEVMWEKLDGIDGDTEYCNAAFLKPAPQTELAPAAGPSLNPEDVLAQRGQSEADFQLALQLSKNSNLTTIDEDEGKLVAAATEASLRSYNGLEEETKTGQEETISMPTNGIIDGCSTQEDSDKLIAMHLQAQIDNESASLHLARKLQNEERQLAAARNNMSSRPTPGRNQTASASNCVIS